MLYLQLPKSCSTVISEGILINFMTKFPFDRNNVDQCDPNLCPLFSVSVKLSLLTTFLFIHSFVRSFVLPSSFQKNAKWQHQHQQLQPLCHLISADLLIVHFPSIAFVTVFVFIFLLVSDKFAMASSLFRFSLFCITLQCSAPPPPSEVNVCPLPINLLRIAKSQLYIK